MIKCHVLETDPGELQDNTPAQVAITIASVSSVVTLLCVAVIVLLLCKLSKKNKKDPTVKEEENPDYGTYYYASGDRRRDVMEVNLSEKWPLYCPQGSGTLRQQLLMMHGNA